MKPTKRIVLTIMIVLTMLTISLSALAQDADTDTPTPEVLATQEAVDTAEPTSELASATPLPTGTPLPTATDLPTLTPVPDFTPTPLPSGGSDGDTGGTRGAPWYEIGGLLLLIVAGGGGLMVMFQRAQRSPELMLAIEKAGDGVPQEAVKPLIDGFTFAIDALKMAVEAIDKIPAASKPGLIAQFTIAELRAEIERQEAAARG